MRCSANSMQLLKMQQNEMVMGGSVSAWKLLILLLSAEFTRSRSSSGYCHRWSWERWSVGWGWKHKFRLPVDNSSQQWNLFGFCLRPFKQRRKSGNQPLVVSPFSSLLDSNENIIVLLRSLSTWPWQVKSLHKLEMDAWLDLASIYTKLEAWHDSNICLDKARSIDRVQPSWSEVNIRNYLTWFC